MHLFTLNRTANILKLISRDVIKKKEGRKKEKKSTSFRFDSFFFFFENDP